MYFIISGKAVVIAPDGKKVLAILKTADYFGEMGIVRGIASVRTASVMAISDLNIAILNI